MSLFSKTPSDYEPVNHSDTEDNGTYQQEPSHSLRISRLRLAVLALVGGLCCFLAGIGFVSILDQLFEKPSAKPYTSIESCPNRSTRQEWRSLSHDQQHSYIEAVNCLRDRPSRIGQNQSLYHDFPYVHARVGEDAHYSAMFLSWHRYFIHVYEKALQEECGFTGNLPYWDWTLDWEDLASSPVWHNHHGFGGSGNGIEYEGQELNGSCVVTGPFADLEVKFIRFDYYPHCLMRGILEGDELHAHSVHYQPSAVEAVLNHESYNSFNLALEDGPHNEVPRSIRGDFTMLTAPADPVFFLHHAQLDRLWWRWQRKELPRTLHEYNGAAEHKSEKEASLDDIVRMGGLAPDVSVSQIMLTEGKLLCYRY